VSLDIVIVSYECREALLRCTASVEGAAPGAFLTVVDNASTDGSAAAVRRTHPAANVLELDSNRGFAVAVNRGVAAGSGRFVLLLNPDAVVSVQAIQTMVAALEANPRLGGVGPLIRDDDGVVELSCGRTMGPLNELGFKIMGRLRSASIPLLGGLIERHYGRSRRVQSLTAACLLLRREAVEELGGLDERFFLYAEDVDLCRRLIGAGWELRYLADATVTHTRGVSAAARPEASELAYRRSQLAFYRKHHPAWVSGLLSAYLRTRYRWASLGGRSERSQRARRLADALLHDE
jgi:GT2 family glycosyltransferase